MNDINEDKWGHNSRGTAMTSAMTESTSHFEPIERKEVNDWTLVKERENKAEWKTDSFLQTGKKKKSSKKKVGSQRRSRVEISCSLSDLVRNRNMATEILRKAQGKRDQEEAPFAMERDSHGRQRWPFAATSGGRERQRSERLTQDVFKCTDDHVITTYVSRSEQRYAASNPKSSENWADSLSGFRVWKAPVELRYTST